MQVWIKHCDAQRVLAKLQFPLICANRSAEPVVVMDCDDSTRGLPLAVLDTNNPSVVNRLQLKRSNSAHSESTGSLHLPSEGLSHSQSLSQSLSLSDDGDDEREHEQCQIIEIGSACSASSRPSRWTPAVIQQLSRKDFENMPPGQCALVAAKSSSALKSLTQRHQAAQKQIRALKRSNKLQLEALSKKQRLLDAARSKSTLEVVPIGRTGKRTSLQSVYAIGIRRNLSNISASDFGATILQDISHQRVTRSEVRTAAAILCRMQDVCSSVILKNSTPDAARPEASESVSAAGHVPISDGEWQLCTISMRCDATNSSIWKRETLHVLDVDFAWVVDASAVRKFDSTKVMRIVRCLRGPWLLAFMSGDVHLLVLHSFPQFQTVS